MKDFEKDFKNLIDNKNNDFEKKFIDFTKKYLKKDSKDI